MRDGLTVFTMAHTGLVVNYVIFTTSIESLSTESFFRKTFSQLNSQYVVKQRTIHSLIASFSFLLQIKYGTALTKVYCGTVVVSDGKTKVLNDYYYYVFLYFYGTPRELYYANQN